MNNKSAPQTGIDADTSEWLEALENIRDCYGDGGVKTLLDDLNEWSRNRNIPLSEDQFNSPYLNTIEVSTEPDYPGDIDLEKSIENILRWNAMAMVLQGQDSGAGVGGHIATYASAATMMEVGFNHILRKRSANYGGDLIIPQPHTPPGVYARSWLEGRLDTAQLESYRRELQAPAWLTPHPHPQPHPPPVHPPLPPRPPSDRGLAGRRARPSSRWLAGYDSGSADRRAETTGRSRTGSFRTARGCCLQHVLHPSGRARRDRASDRL